MCNRQIDLTFLVEDGIIKKISADIPYEKSTICEEVDLNGQLVIDVTDPTFTGLKAALEVRDEVKDILDLQIVACPQEGMYAYKSGDELVEEGLKMGADCVGAIPHFELKLTFA